MTQKYITYLRVSTEKQRQSQLGIDAQRSIVMAHIKQHQGELVAELVDYESGKKTSDEDRPNLHKAIRLLKVYKDAKLLLARTDRLARDLHFISGLLKENVPLIVAGHEGMTKLEWHMHAMIAEHEADMISQRTKAALAEAKRRGVRLGAPKQHVNRIAQMGGHAFRDKVHAYNKKIIPVLKTVLRDPAFQSEYDTGKPSWTKIATHLNNLGYKTIRNNYFKPDGIYRIVKGENLEF